MNLLLVGIAVGLATGVALARGPVGGGVLQAGWRGEYFANPDLAGPPAFTRREVRLRFDWGTKRPVGGSTAEPYRSFPRDNFSARWTGQVTPRFSEAYTFRLTFDEGARLWVDGQPVIDQWTRAGDFQSRPIALAAGRAYDVKLEYRNLTGPARVILRWSSPNTPEEVIEPAAEHGLNLATWSGGDGHLFADAVWEGRWATVRGEPPTAETVDENGWPRGDAELVLAENGRSRRGMYALRFAGQAAVELAPARGKFIVAGREYAGQLPRGAGYDDWNNTTTAQLWLEDEEGTWLLRFTATSRDGSEPGGTGITQLQLLRPVANGANTPHQWDEIGYRPMKRLLEEFTCLRWATGGGANVAGTWPDRTPATFARLVKPAATETNDAAGENWERLVMLANETGRDLYLCLPALADNEYVTKLAALLQYGSDGREPSDGPVDAPRFPPLNPNLCVYFTIGQELWHWWAPATQQACLRSFAEVEQGTPDGKIINGDGKITTADLVSLRRWQALRTLRASEMFRSVMGRDAFGARYRPVLESQTGNGQNTAALALDFLDGYFNNGWGNFVKEPQPVSRYLWGAGGAAYYGVANPDGVQVDVVVPDESFETVPVPAGSAATVPPGAAWKFAGAAGLYRPWHSAVAEYASGKRIGQNTNTAYGFKFRVGHRPLHVYQLGRYFMQASEGAVLYLLRDSDKAVMLAGETGPIASHALRGGGYFYTPPPRSLARLDPHTTYTLVTVAKGDRWTATAADDTPAPTNAPGLTILAATKAAITQRDRPAAWQFTDTAAQSVFGPVTLLYSFQPQPAPAWPLPVHGQQAAVIHGQGDVTTTVNFPQPGHYALAFLAHANTDSNLFVLVDNQSVVPRSQSDYRRAAASDPLRLGGWGRDGGFKEEWGTAVFTITTPGAHTVRFSGRGGPGSWVVLDCVRVASVGAVVAGGFGASNEIAQAAADQWREAQTRDAQLALVHNLAAIAYNGGWCVGGWPEKPLHSHVKFQEPATGQIQATAAAMLQRSGLRLPVWGAQRDWPAHDFARAFEYPLLHSLRAATRQLPATPDLFPVAPCLLNFENSVRWSRDANNSRLSERGRSLGWTFVVPAAGLHQITVDTTGEGRFDWELDGARVDEPQDTNQVIEWKLRLPAGVHGLRVRNLDGEFNVDSVKIAPVP